MSEQSRNKQLWLIVNTKYSTNKSKNMSFESVKLFVAQKVILNLWNKSMWYVEGHVSKSHNFIFLKVQDRQNSNLNSFLF